MLKINKDKMVGLEIRTVNNLLKRDFKSLPVHKKFENLTGMQRWIIGYLSEHQEIDVFQRDLEEKFSIRRSTATGILQLMEKNDLLIRESVSYDSRLKKLVLTPKAIEIQKMICEEIQENEEKICKGICKEDLEEFFKVMEQIKKNLEK